MSNAVDHDEVDVPMSGDIHDEPYAGSRFDLEPDANGYTFTGIDPLDTAPDGREIVIVNASSTFSVTLAHDSVSSATGNRLFFSDNADHVLGPHQMVWGLRITEVAGRVGWWLQF